MLLDSINNSGEEETFL